MKKHQNYKKKLAMRRKVNGLNLWKERGVRKYIRNENEKITNYGMSKYICLCKVKV